MLNSTHLEAGPEKMEKVFGIAKQHNAAVLILTIDEQGMAKTVERKLEVARRIYDIAINQFGFAPEDLVYDTLTFPLSTGDPEFADSASRHDRVDPADQGGTARCVHLAGGQQCVLRPEPGGPSGAEQHDAAPRRAGWSGYGDRACLQGQAVCRDPGRRTRLDGGPDLQQAPGCLQRVIEFYENVQVTDEEAADPTEGMTPEERLYWSILHRHKEGVEDAIDEIIARKDKPATTNRR